MITTLLKNKHLTIMTNRKFFKSVSNTELVLDKNLSIGFLDFSEEHIRFNVLSNLVSAPILEGNIYLSGRGFECNVSYSDPNDCIFSPYELRTWCPRLYFRYTNYLKWIEAYAYELKYLISRYMTYYLTKKNKYGNS